MMCVPTLTPMETEMIDTSDPLFSITVPKELKNSNNGQSRHWSSSHKDKKEFMVALDNSHVVTDTGVKLGMESFIHDILGGEPLSQKVGLIVERVLGKRQRLWDSDSVLRGNAKQAIDSVVDFGILTDDSTKFVSWSLGIQDDTCKADGPFTRIHFYGIN